MWLVSTFDAFDQYLQLFEDAEIVGRFDGLIIKKKVGPLSLCLGLFDGDNLVAYSWTVKFISQYNMLHSFELRVHEQYQRRGIAFFFYMHILLTDRTAILVSDYSHSILAGKLWDKLARTPQIKVGMYNHINDTISWDNPVDKEKVYHNDYMHFVAKAE